VLVAQVLAREDGAAFEQLVERHQGRIRRWLRQLCGDAALADDLAQETFVSAWLKIRSFSGKGRFVSWLMSIAYNAFLQSRRRDVRDSRLVEMLATHGSDAAVSGEALPAHVDLQTVLGMLSSDERATIVLCYGFGYSHAEVAEIVDMPVGTVKSHIRRGRLKIDSGLGSQEAR